MEGESEYSFWHLLVRDVAYGQIPRAERARRHRSAAAWIERKGGERVEDLAEVLAHHYLQALELAEAAGDTRQAEELALPARRFLALAGERALGLDTAQAEARLVRALGLASAEDPERPDLLVRWADAAFQAGRPRDAAAALDEALTSLRARGETEAAARALQLRSIVALRLGEGRHVPLAAEAVALLEEQMPGPALVAAYSQLANAQMIAGSYSEAIAAADRARGLTESLGLPQPARALGYRGYARALLGDRDGLAEAEGALALLVERGAGRDAATLQNNLAIARYPLQGPARSLSTSSGASPSASSVVSPRWRGCSRPTVRACWQSSAAPRRRSNAPAGSPPRSRRAATRSRCARCARSSSRAASPVASRTRRLPRPTGWSGRHERSARPT